MKESLPLKPAVFCDKCPRALIYDEHNGIKVLRHDDYVGCERAGQLFRAPMIELERLDK